MAQYLSIGKTISFESIRDYIFTNKLSSADSIVLNIADFESLIYEMRIKSEHGIQTPIKILDVIITTETSDSVPVGKLEVVIAQSSSKKNPST